MKLRNTIAALVLASTAMAQNPFGGAIAPPKVPNDLEVPTGNIAFLRAHAEGTQNYLCMASATGLGWRFIGPQATLFLRYPWINGEVRQQVATHYLSPNLVEEGTARPTWQSSFDTSAVWAKANATSSDPSFVAAGAIPWLLLEVTGSRRLPTGGNTLSHTTYLQRIDTTGGVAPSTGCTEAADIGTTAFVPYTAGYVFYRKAGKP